MAITYLGTRNDAKAQHASLVVFFLLFAFWIFRGEYDDLSLGPIRGFFLGRTAWKMRVQQKGLSQSKRSEGLFCGKKN